MSFVLKTDPLGIQQPGYNTDTPLFKLHFSGMHGGIPPFPTRRNGAVASKQQGRLFSPSSCVTQSNFL